MIIAVKVIKVLGVQPIQPIHNIEKYIYKTEEQRNRKEHKPFSFRAVLESEEKAQEERKQEESLNYYNNHARAMSFTNMRQFNLKG